MGFSNRRALVRCGRTNRIPRSLRLRVLLLCRWVAWEILSGVLYCLQARLNAKLGGNRTLLAPGAVAALQVGLEAFPKHSE